MNSTKQGQGHPRLRRHLTFGASACLVLAALAPQSALYT